MITNGSIKTIYLAIKNILKTTVMLARMAEQAGAVSFSIMKDSLIEAVLYH